MAFVEISVEDDGSVYYFSSAGQDKETATVDEALDLATQRLNDFYADPEVTE